MFKVRGNVFQEAVSGLTKGAKRARLGESRVFVNASANGEVIFYFVGEELQVEKRISVEVVKEFAFATTVMEFDMKVSALPDDELITVEMDGDKLDFKWGRSSKISVNTVPERSPLIEIPTAVDSVIWKPGYLQELARTLPSFTALTNSEKAMANPVLRGLFIEKNDMDEVLVKATNATRAVTVRPQGVEWFSGIAASIPTDTVSGLAEILSSQAEVKVSVNEGHSLILFEAGDTRAISRLLVGSFPPIDNAYTPEEEAKSIWRVDRMDLLNTARRIKRLGGNSPCMVFKKDGAKAFIELKGVLIEQIGADIDGVDFEFAVHSDFLELCLALYRTEEVLLCLKESDSPITILSEGSDDLKTLIAQVLID